MPHPAAVASRACDGAAENSTVRERTLEPTANGRLDAGWNLVAGSDVTCRPASTMMPGIDLRPSDDVNVWSWEERFNLDVRYVEQNDLRMDLSIPLRTVRIVLSRSEIRHAEGVDMPEFFGSETKSAAAEAP